MGLSSVLLYKGYTLWQGLLLTASLLTCWHLSTTAKVTIESVPSPVIEGENVLFSAKNLPENLLAFAWYKRVKSMRFGIGLFSLTSNLSATGPGYSGRETLYRNGSLWLTNVTTKDKGFYTLRTINRSGKVVSTTRMFLRVYSSLFTCGRPHPSALPTIELVPPNFPEGENVLLLAHNLPTNLKALFWYKGVTALRKFEIARHIRAPDLSVQGPAHSGREALFRNGSLMFYNVLWKDNGFYTLRILTTDLKTEIAHVQLQIDTTLSTCCRDLTSAQVTIESKPRYVAEGGSVLLLVHNLPEDLQAFFWYKSVYRTDIFKIVEYSSAIKSTIWGLAHSQRELVYTNGSLLLQNVTNEDAGLYMLETLNRDSKIEKAFVQLHVKKPVTQPFVRLSDTTVTVQSSVVLTCFSADPGISTHWILNKKSLQLTERMKLSKTKCQLTIDPVRREDAGEYKCEVSNPVSSKMSLPVRLTVRKK
ncbi:pregnancy-specific glycoprotein 22 isoform X1 [Cricetulus griseus]|uniref:pregnancy-specific glycoprotein 22 isoform X1 n=1 Tax=Cricetulus griseus TaxID=10029 RepID=UPI000F746076|nr:pregnancy-specific glycoprotein 22 isoform X1 [Cricetulus griseus]